MAKVRSIELKIKPNQENVVYAISLVDMPAIESNFMAFKKEEIPIMLSFDEDKHIITGPALIPNKKMWRTPESLGQKEGAFVYASDDTVIQCAQMFLANLKNNSVTLMHQVPTDGVKLIESWIVVDPKTDKSAALGFKDIPKNTWFVSYKIENPEVWNLCKSKKLQGFSIESIFALGKVQESEEEYSELAEMMDYISQFETQDANYPLTMCKLSEEEKGHVIKTMRVQCAAYPWDTCISDQKAKGLSDESASKICGYIKSQD
jgi:hypothetical protein